MSHPSSLRCLALGCLALAVCAAPALAQIKAFPQAEGFGAAARGGRGGDVYHVTSLLDNGSVGTLRHGIESAPTTGRTIVFDVGGWITLNSNLGIVSSKRNITIAGQTAPGGIGVRGGKFSVGADDVVIRHMTFRPGKGAGRQDSVNTNADAQRVIYDHISAGFSYDENFSVQATDVTLQFSTVSYGLQDHSAGSLLENPTRLTMHHNLYAHNHTRNPKARVFETLDWINNVVYDYNIGMNLDGTDSAGYFWTQNIDGNYYITGPGDTGNRIVSGGSVDDYGTWWGVNAYDGDGDSVHDGADYVRGTRDFGTVWGGLTTWSDTPYPRTDPVWQEATTQAAYERVLAEFGATPWNRGEVDQLLHNDVVNRTGTILTHENQLVARGVSNGGFGTLGGVTGPLDTDRDGIPDAWELKHGLPINAASNNGDFDDDGYTNLEEYLNDMGAFKAAGALKFEGDGRYADWNNWTRRWEPSRLDEVHVDQGHAVVDAVGQRAGSLKLGTSAGDDAELTISNGWLEVADELVIGADDGATARLALTGGRLRAEKLTKGAGGEFAFTGGVLAVDDVGFSLTNTAGTIAPGSSIGHMHVAGDLTLQGGILEIELDSGLSDTITVDGTVTLGGTLHLKYLDGVVPDSGRWEIIKSTEGIDGNFVRFPFGLKTRVIGNSVFVLAVPEPSSMLLLGMACLIGAARFRAR
jgi:pectate lyase